MRSAILTAIAMLLGFIGVFSISCAGQQSPSIRVTVVDQQGALVPWPEAHIVGQPDRIGFPTTNGTISFKGIAPGIYQIAVTCRGFKNEDISDVVVTEGKTTELNITLKEAPPKASDYRIHQTFDGVQLYSKALVDIGQPLLCPKPVPTNKEWYRFMWVPTFEHPAFLRVDVEADGTGTLLTQVWSGAGGYEWGKSVKNTRKLTLEEESTLYETLADIGFWTLPSHVERPPNVVVLDGTEWLIEGVKDGECHVVTRYSSPLTELFETHFLAGVAKLKPYDKPDR